MTHGADSAAKAVQSARIQAEAIIDTIAVIADAMRLIAARFKAVAARARAEEELSSLDDRLLADIGIRRDDIPRIVKSID